MLLLKSHSITYQNLNREQAHWVLACIIDIAITTWTQLILASTRCILYTAVVICWANWTCCAFYRPGERAADVITVQRGSLSQLVKAPEPVWSVKTWEKGESISWLLNLSYFKILSHSVFVLTFKPLLKGLPPCLHFPSLTHTVLYLLRVLHI